MCKNTCRISFFLVSCTLLFSQFHLMLCEEDDSNNLMDDLNQLRIPSRELADTRTGDFPNQKKLSIFIRNSGGGSWSAISGGSSPGGRGGGSSPGGRGGGSSPAGGGGSRPVIGAGAAGTGSQSGGSRISSSFNGGCVLSIVYLLAFFLYQWTGILRNS